MKNKNETFADAVDALPHNMKLQDLGDFFTKIFLVYAVEPTQGTLLLLQLAGFVSSPQYAKNLELARQKDQRYDA